MSKRPAILRLSAEGMADNLERIGDLQSSNDPREVVALTLIASRWIENRPVLAGAFNRLSRPGQPTRFTKVAYSVESGRKSSHTNGGGVQKVRRCLHRTLRHEPS